MDAAGSSTVPSGSGGATPPERFAALTIGDDVLRARHEAGLRSAVRGEVRFGKHDRMLYATDASIYQVEPLGVVVPADVEDAIAAARYCIAHGLPILPRGGGTSLAGQGVNRAVVIDFSANCRRVLEIDAYRRRCRVEVGITIDDLNDQLRPHGLFFAPDPATARQCNIGGAIGNNAAGTRSILYGRTSESVLGVDVLLADGAIVRLEKGASLRRDDHVRRLTNGVIEIVRRHETLIRERFPKTLRRNAGYALDAIVSQFFDKHEMADNGWGNSGHPQKRINLAKLICGSEGTLAITLSAELALHSIPKAKGLAVLGFASLEAAIDAVVPLLTLKPSAVELLDDLVIGLARQNSEYAKYVELMPQPRGGTLEAVLYVEFFSQEGPAEIERKFEAVRQVMEDIGAAGPGTECQATSEPESGAASRATPEPEPGTASRATSGPSAAFYTDTPSMNAALKLRKAGEPLLHGIPGNRKPLGFVEDNAVPVEHLAEFVREFKRIVETRGTRAAFWAHASVGVLHVRPLLDMRDERDRRSMEEIAVEVVDLAKRLGGVMSGEHGDGRARGPLLERFYGPELMGAFRDIKRLFDPNNLLNPGNIVDPGPIESIHEATRVRPTGFDVHAANIDTYFDYASESGFDHAVELCNGSGVCRKKAGGTMCPSYMATLDERHSTRGRGNALRLAITGQLAEDAEGRPGTECRATSEPMWGDTETLETLNLCLSCKACKTECPSNVDISKYKAEYLAQTYRAAGRTPLKALAFGRVRLSNRLGSMVAPIANAFANNPVLRMIVDPVLGLSRKRTLPRYARSLYRRWGAGEMADAPCVVLFTDCFTTYNDPHIGLAAARLLRACGYRVVLPPESMQCCGRPQVSTGLLGEAKSCAGASAQTLFETVEREKAVAVVVCEPSCLSSIKDEWRTLKLPVPGTALDRLAAMSFLVEDFAAREWDRHPRRPTFEKPTGNVVLHGHCHQKALWGTETSAALLRRVAGAERVRVLDTGCCGMAGSFGYMADKYDLSMKIGELALFPEARKLGPDDVLIAPGTSCRHQIHDGVKLHALHPVEFAAGQLARESL